MPSSPHDFTPLQHHLVVLAAQSIADVLSDDRWTDEKRRAHFGHMASEYRRNATRDIPWEGVYLHIAGMYATAAEALDTESAEAMLRRENDPRA